MEKLPKPFDPKNSLKDALVSLNIQLDFNLKSIKEKYDNYKALEEKLANTPASASLDDEEPEDLSHIYDSTVKLWNKYKDFVKEIEL